MKNAIAILAGGGPAPGMNTVISSVAKTFLGHGYRVIGLHDGYKGLFSREPKMLDIDYGLADEIFARGGSYLHMGPATRTLPNGSTSVFSSITTSGCS